MTTETGDPWLMTPGPLTTSLSVKQAMLHDWGSRDTTFIAMTARVRSKLVDLVVTGALGAAMVGCISAPSPEDRSETAAARTQRPAATPAIQQTQPPRSAAPVLYARDGTPVSAAGSVAQEPVGPLSTRDLAGSQGGRMYILELYQNVIEERDGLALEVSALQAELEATRAALIEADGEIGELQATVASMQAEQQSMLEENLELAARLTTAQIRRLQAEKLLLEVRLEQERTRVADAQTEMRRP